MKNLQSRSSLDNLRMLPSRACKSLVFELLEKMRRNPRLGSITLRRLAKIRLSQCSRVINPSLSRSRLEPSLGKSTGNFLAIRLLGSTGSPSKNDMYTTVLIKPQNSLRRAHLPSNSPLTILINPMMMVTEISSPFVEFHWKITLQRCLQSALASCLTVCPLQSVRNYPLPLSPITLDWRLLLTW